MVCLGNICRSPMAEGILRSKIENNNSSLFIDSCGTGPRHVGQSPDKRAIAALKQKGIDISLLAKGTYLLQLMDKETKSISVQKFIKE